MDSGETTAFVAFTYKELGYSLYMTRRFTIEIEYNGGHEPPAHKRQIKRAPRLFPVG
jgi:hypothetical protein